MSIDELLDLARNGNREIQDDWMPATSVRPIILDDPALVWLENFGEANGFKAEESPYDFLKFIGEKAQHFEEKWIREVASTAIVVCGKDYEVRSIGKVLETIGHLYAGAPAIAKPALWWGPERIYGVPDLVVHTSWLEQRFPQLFSPFEKNSIAANLPTGGRPGHYVVFDIKFTTGLDGSDKKISYANYSAQVRIYSYMLGHLQGVMPRNAYLVTRDRLFDPLPVGIISALGQPLDVDLMAVRDQFREIKVHGSKYRPWKDSIVTSNLSNEDERWGTAKDVIARERFGMTLTEANCVIHYDRWWNPAVEDQATDRVHRIGQKKPVKVFKIHTRGTIDERIDELQAKKKDLFNSVIEVDQMRKEITKAELLALFAAPLESSRGSGT